MSTNWWFINKIENIKCVVPSGFTCQCSQNLVEEQMHSVHWLQIWFHSVTMQLFCIWIGDRGQLSRCRIDCWVIFTIKWYHFTPFECIKFERFSSFISSARADKGDKNMTDSVDGVSSEEKMHKQEVSLWCWVVFSDICLGFVLVWKLIK